MLLNKHNLNIAALCSKEESRFTLNSILVTPDATVETDGHQLVKVTLPPDMKAESFPVREGQSPAVDSWKPFLLPASEALNIAKALPKKTTMPVLKYAAVTEDTDKNGHSSIAVTDLEMARVFNTKKPEGNFPDFERIMPKKEDAEFRIAFNAELLRRVLQQVEAFRSEEHNAECVFSFASPSGPLRVDARNGQGQEFTGVIMPLRADKVDGCDNPAKYERRKRAEALLEEFIEDYQKEPGTRIKRPELYAKVREALGYQDDPAATSPERTPDQVYTCAQCQKDSAIPTVNDLCAECASTWEAGKPDEPEPQPVSVLDQVVAAHEERETPGQDETPAAAAAQPNEKPADWNTWGPGKKAAWTRKYGKKAA